MRVPNICAIGPITCAMFGMPGGIAGNPPGIPVGIPAGIPGGNMKGILGGGPPGGTDCDDVPLDVVVLQENLYFNNNAALLRLSNSDHMTPIPFNHFAIVLTSWYRRTSSFWWKTWEMLLWHHEIQKVFLRIWAYALRNVQFLHDFTTNFWHFLS